MRFFVTGAAGFIGSNLVRYLLGTHRGCQVLSYDVLSYAGNLENLEAVMDHSQHSFVKGDIGDQQKIKEIFSSFRPDIVIHLAAETHVDRSIDESDPFIETNVVGQTHLLKSCQEYYEHLSGEQRENFRFLHISTDEIFGALAENDPPFNEATPYAPRSPYSASKAAGDHLVRAWYHTYGLPVILLNCSNNYGSFQFPEKLIPLMISNAIAGRDLPVYGEGLQIRDWLYVEDHCDAILRALTQGKVGETYCIGGGTEKRNIDLVEEICSVLDTLKPLPDQESYRSKICFVPDRPGHDFRYAIDSSKAEKELGWHASTSFKDGLQKTVSWYLENEDWIQAVQRKNKQAT